MKSGSIIILVGIVMVILGLILFYSIKSSSDLEPSLKAIKNSGTFVGLMGIGVSIAGVLLYFISRNQPDIPENFDPDLL